MISVGVVIARFQTYQLTHGHTALLLKALSENQHVLVLLGCSELDGRTRENPLYFMQRAHVVRMALTPEESRRTTVMPLANMSDNRAWTRQVDMISGSAFPTANIQLYIGRDSVIPACYSGQYPIIQIDKQDGPSGTQIRESIQMSTGLEFAKGQIFALNQQFPHAYQCVDVAIIDNKKLVLLIQRADTGEWALPGGFVDPTDETLERAALREAREETGLSCEDTCRYVSSRLINDWRYRGQDKIMTALFTFPYSFGVPRTNGEALAFQWAPIQQAAERVSPHHRALIFDLLNWQRNSCYS